MAAPDALKLRRLLLLCGAFAAAAGVAGGLARVGVPLPGGADHVALHGPLLAVGLFVTVIGLERAVALGARLALVVPAVGAASVAAMVLRVPVAAALSVVAAAGLVVLNVALLRRSRATYSWITCGASALVLVGNLRWASGHPIFTVVGTWIAFLALTIAAERLRWSKAVPIPRWARPWLPLLAALSGVAAVAQAIRVDHASRGLGVALALIALWQLRFDASRDTFARPGMPGFIATGVRAGASWLLVAGVLLAREPLPPAGPYYDAALHTVFVGQVLSTVFAHAPTMLASVGGIGVPFTTLLYVPLVLLHVSLASRVYGDLADVLWARRAGSLGNAIALALFAVTLVVAVWFPRRGGDTGSPSAT